MTWSSPYTAVLNDTLTAAIWNATVRDDMAETEAFNGSGNEGAHFINIAAHSVESAFTNSNVISATENTVATSYGNLATFGPSVNAGTDTSALVFMSAEVSNSSTDSSSRFSFSVIGATTVAPSDDWSCLMDGLTAFSTTRRSVAHRITGLTAGVNTFTMKYLAGSGIASFGKREIVVIPF